MVCCWVLQPQDALEEPSQLLRASQRLVLP